MRFISGFIVASLLWGGLFYAYLQGHLDAFLPAGEPVVATNDAPAEPELSSAPGKRRGLRRPRLRRSQGSAPSRSAGAQQGSTGNSTVGDDLGWDKERNVDMAAGEAQLSGGQIDAGFDSVMGRIRRCLILVPSDGEVTGKLVFGMRVGGDGKPKAVNLSGPSIVTAGESGSCLRDAANAIRFPAFDGPDMLFKYPITLQ